jgi:hypothetical protein
MRAEYRVCTENVRPAKKDALPGIFLPRGRSVDNTFGAGNWLRPLTSLDAKRLTEVRSAM